MGDIFVGETVRVIGLETVRLEPRHDTHLLEEGDLLFARRSIVLEGSGKCAIVPRLRRPTVYESSIIRARVDESVANPEFCLHFFNSPQGRRQIRSIIRRGAVSGVSGADIQNLQVPIPAVPEQVACVERIHAVGDALKQLETQLGRSRDMLHSLREALLVGSTGAAR
jgi:type I restriction enzyme S subunit